MIVHREEIDGLRAIAVVSVILYHAGFKMYFSGGYVGVDIFFVISGYLITSIIHKECQQNTFSLINFYERRCRRILPALFLILFLTSLFSYYLMLPEQLKEFGETLLSITGLSSNFYFWYKDDGYFSQLSELNPLVHTWSLAVEEQFYFVFPILCFLFYRKKIYLIILLICLSGFSLFVAQWGGNFQSMRNEQFQMFSQHRFASFYLPFGRIWELLLGAFLAFYLQSNDSTKYVLSSASYLR
jgi:peptidoglycan/LPS O-acetylase OafA/YrhL